MVSVSYYGEFVDSQANVARIAQRLGRHIRDQKRAAITPGTQICIYIHRRSGF